MSDLGAARGKILIDTSDINRAVNEARRGSELMTKALGAIGVGTGLAAVKQLGEMAFNLAENAANANRTRSAFDALAASVGQSADSMLEDMRKASRGMVADTELILHANQAMLLNVAKSGEELGQLLNAARVLGQAMGKDTASSFNDLVIGLGRLSPRILDNLGIANEGEKTFSNYAKSIGKTAKSLTDAEKKQALINQVMKAAQPLLDAEAKAGDNAANKFERFSAELENSKKKLGDFLLEAGATDSLEKLGDGFDESIKAMERFDNWLKTLKKDWDAWNDSAGTSPVLDAIAKQNQEIQDWIAHVGVAIGTREPFGQAEAIRRDEGRHAGLGRMGRANRATERAATGPVSFDEDQTKLIVDWARDVADIERQANADRLDATRQYEEQRTSVIRDYGKMMARDAQDFGIQRARAEADQLEQLNDVRSNAARRESRQIEDFERNIGRARADSEESIADAREDANKRLVEMEEDYQKGREKAQQAHRDRLIDAAGRLDAQAVYEEQRNFARESKDAEDAHNEQRDDLNKQLDERIADEKEALAESIADARDAHERQLEEGREADELRLQDMRDDFEQRKILEDEDRALRLARAAEDHADQLAEMDRQHALDLEQISLQEAEKRAKVQTEFDAAMAELGIMTEAWIKENKRVTDAAIADYMRATNAIALLAAGLNPIGAGTGGSHPSLADPYANSPEYTSRTPSGNSKTVNIHPGAITIHGDGLNEREVAELLINMLGDQ